MPTDTAEARAAAARILQHVEINGDDPHDDGLLMFEAEITTVARFALEAADREARLTEALNLAGSGLAATYAHFMREGAERDAADVLEMINKVDAALAPASGEE